VYVKQSYKQREDNIKIELGGQRNKIHKVNL